MRRRGTGLWTLRKSLRDSRKRPQPLLLNAGKTSEENPKTVTHVPGLNCYPSPRPYNLSSEASAKEEGSALILSSSTVQLRAGSEPFASLRAGSAKDLLSFPCELILRARGRAVAIAALAPQR